ncbi:hypothetical protein GCM10022251_24870 [Phytohabitans flavus]|uniref:Uncharacterized protein n=1 Tax=Phytohabitans flavus TaxID=1076124 RepID=A0A6F8XR71_9ACTN|nr:hypothetical protein [Phytohabitans flavus]BCB76310.1 hypothetical protein Pflav_027200 [Phytohabitans flavus]
MKVDRGGAGTHRWGSVAELVPGPVPAGAAARQLLVLAIVLFVAAAGVAAFGSFLGLVVAMGGLASLIASGQREGARRRPGRILAPGFDREAPDYCLLAAPEDRNALGAALNIGKRICRTLPSLAGMVDTDAAERLLASALFDLAKVLQHRQDVRTLLIELRRQRHRGLPADSPAARKLMAQRDRLKQALSDLDAEVARRLGELEATAVASENFMREREIHQVTSRVDQTLASLAPTPLPGTPDSGLELADEIAAVLAAYRELNERYGAPG